MYIIIERHTNRHDNIYDAFIVRPVYYNSLEKAIAKAKSLFEDCRDRSNLHLIPMDTEDLRDDDHEVTFGIGEFEDGAFDDYYHYFEVVELRNADEVESEKPNTRINYLYRDADNYKEQNSVIVPGRFTEAQKHAIIESLDQGDYFVPSAVGFEEVRFDTFGDADHAFFELNIYGFEETDEEPTVEMTPDEVVAAFETCADKWDELASKRYYELCAEYGNSANTEEEE